MSKLTEKTTFTLLQRTVRHAEQRKMPVETHHQIINRVLDDKHPLSHDSKALIATSRHIKAEHISKLLDQPEMTNWTLKQAKHTLHQMDIQGIANHMFASNVGKKYEEGDEQRKSRHAREDAHNKIRRNFPQFPLEWPDDDHVHKNVNYGKSNE